MKLYSKENAVKPIEAMSRSGRFVHSYILTGEKGTGKKTFARYIAMQLLCDNHNACGECHQCSRVLRGQHPDFIEVMRENGKVNYSVEDIRTKVVADSFISPNDCERKVYLLTDCEGWQDSCQDALLKITEDPPDAAYFIFTAANKNSFLPTLISRSMTIELHEADKESCKEALRDKGYSEEDISRAVDSFGGNIGNCIDFLEGDNDLIKSAEAVKKAMDAIVRRDEYALAAILGSISSKREEMRKTLEMLARSIRDGAAVRNGGKDTVSCTEGSSRKLAERFSTGRILAMYDAVCEASYRCTANCNAQAAAAVLAGKLCR